METNTSYDFRKAMEEMLAAAAHPPWMVSLYRFTDKIFEIVPFLMRAMLMGYLLQMKLLRATVQKWVQRSDIDERKRRTVETILDEYVKVYEYALEVWKQTNSAEDLRNFLIDRMIRINLKVLGVEDHSVN